MPNLAEGSGRAVASLQSFQELQSLQNRAVRMILHCDSSQDTFRLLNWIDLASRRKMHKRVLVFKRQNNLAPKYLHRYFVKNSSFHGYNTRRIHDLHLLQPKNNLGKRTFSCSGTVYFNALPDEIKHSLFLCTFERLVYKYFFSFLICYFHFSIYDFCSNLIMFLILILS